MKRRLKSGIFFVLYYSGLEWVVARLIRVNAAAMLMYHGVCDCAEIPAEINFHLPRRVFERQMRALKSRYRVVSVGDLVQRLERGQRVDKAISITFDDGYRNNATQAAPILSTLGLPYTVFLATKYIGTDEWLPLNRIYWAWSEGKIDSERVRELRKQIRECPAAEFSRILSNVPPTRRSERADESFAMLNWSEVNEMAAAGASFGSHTHTHCNMALESRAYQEQELRLSQDLIERHTARQPGHFAYPYGHAAEMSELARASIAGTGFRSAISAEYGLITSRSDRFRLPRLGYDAAIWNFTGEILYQFVKQLAKDIWLSVSGRKPHSEVRAGLH